MQRGPLIAACATVACAVGLAVFAANRGGSETGDQEPGIVLHSGGAKSGTRSEKRPAVEDTGTEPAQITERRPSPADPLGVGRNPDLDRVLSKAQREELEKALAAGREARKAQGGTDEPDHARLAAHQDAEVLREKLRSAIATNPDNWISDYESLHADYMARHHPGIGWGQGGDAGGGTDSGSGNPDLPNLEEAARLRVIYDQHRAIEPPLRTYVDPRFKPEP